MYKETGAIEIIFDILSDIRVQQPSTWDLRLVKRYGSKAYVSVKHTRLRHMEKFDGLSMSASHLIFTQI